ncbi:hypothetical protein ACCC88_12180 [Sphingomonas sp. Sphisp140]
MESKVFLANAAKMRRSAATNVSCRVPRNYAASFQIKTWEDWMSALYLGLAVVCVVGVSACLGGMYLILRSTPAVRRPDEA